jgi:hypothetical protein
LKLALAFEVGQTKSNFPGSPHAVNGREALPTINLLLEVLGCKDSCQGHHHKSTSAMGMPVHFAFF